jgi:hypothetical protein
MKKYLFKCNTCNTVMTIETNLDEERIHHAPPCPCGKSRMLDMASKEYAYGGWDV